VSEKRDFDKAAATWDDEPRRVKLAREVAQAVVAAVPLSGDMDVMDFGCGTGLVTLFLQPSVRSITAVDTSRGMLDVLEAKVHKHGIANVRTHLLDAERDAPPPGRYHLIVSSMTLHHVADPAPLFRLFRDLLLPGGWLCVADLDREDGSFHDDPTGVLHFGFERTSVKGLLTEAGFMEVSDTTAAVIHKSSPVRTGDYPVFLISCRRPHP